MVNVQILFVALFALNLVQLWVSFLSGKYLWYRFPAYLLMLIIPLPMVLYPQPRFELDYFWWKVAGVAALLLGAAVIAWAVRELENKRAAWHDIEPKTLVISGPYQYLRHPMYLGFIFILVGWWWVWAAAYAFYFGMFVLAMIWLQGYLEEKMVLEKKFGKKFMEYRGQTGMFWIK